MTLHFAYGSNMSRALMRMRCPGAREVGRAILDGYRFIIMQDGYASVVPSPGTMVHGLLWRLTPRDLAVLNAYEGVDRGHYRALMLPVRAGRARVSALVYIGGSRRPGVPQPGYMELILAAASDLQLPDAYIRALARWAPARFTGRRAPAVGEIAS